MTVSADSENRQDDGGHLLGAVSSFDKTTVDGNKKGLMNVIHLRFGRNLQLQLQQSVILTTFFSSQTVPLVDPIKVRSIQPWTEDFNSEWINVVAKKVMGFALLVGGGVETLHSLLEGAGRFEIFEYKNKMTLFRSAK